MLVLQVLRAIPKTAHVPILVVTGQPDPEALLKTAALGQDACGFLYKPYEPEALVVRVRQMLDKKGDAAPGPEELASPAGKLRYLRRGPLIADTFGKRMWIDGRAAAAPTERRFDLFCALMRREGSVSRKELLHQVWDDNHEIGIVGITVMRLRKDLCGHPGICVASSHDGYELIFHAA